jgi:hypothetical protein
MFKMAFVGAIAEWFVGGEAAAANGYYRPALQAVIVALHVDYFKITFYFYRSVIVYRKLCCCHNCLFCAEDNSFALQNTINCLIIIIINTLSILQYPTSI